MDTNNIVYIVDDDPDVLDATCMLLESTGLQTRPYSSARSFLKNIKQSARGCIILDVRMPNMSGLTLQAEIKRRKINLPVIFITGHGDVPMAVEAMKNGALEFFQKPFRDQEFIDCVNRALDINQDRIDNLNRTHSIQRRMATLTKREQQIMQYMIDGHITKVIAHKLAISPRTVETHRARVMEKMQAKTLAQLIHMVIKA
jgi:two-component system, LuxR family, response regulator FixJ